jgi:serine/threonine protein kinase
MALFPSISGTNLTGRTVDTPDGMLKFQRRLISGSSGTVYIAEYTKSRRQVAVKVIPRSNQSADRSAEEFHTQQDVQAHENIAHTVALYSNVRLGHHSIHGFTGDLLVFDFYRGGDLFTAIASHNYGAQEDKIRDTFLQVLSAVEYCHQHGVSHRDIKPENILCSEDGRHVFLADFGLATTEDMVHHRCGSPMYMSWGKQVSIPSSIRSSKLSPSRMFHASIWRSHYLLRQSL